MSMKSLLLSSLAAITLLQSCFQEEDDHVPHWNTVRVWKDWRLDFEAGLPRTGTYFNGTTHTVSLTGNYDQPLSGGRDLKLTAVLNGTKGEGWAGVWVKHPSDKDMDASGATGIRFRLKSSTARDIQVMLSSFAYPDYTNGAKLTGTIKAAKGVQTVEVKFVDFVYPSWLYKSGQFCGTSRGAEQYCTTRMSDVLERINAIQFQMDPRWDANGNVEDDWAAIQVDDIQFVFP